MVSVCLQLKTLSRCSGSLRQCARMPPTTCAPRGTIQSREHSHDLLRRGLPVQPDVLEGIHTETVPGDVLDGAVCHVRTRWRALGLRDWQQEGLIEHHLRQVVDDALELRVVAGTNGLLNQAGVAVRGEVGRVRDTRVNIAGEERGRVEIHQAHRL